MKVSHVPYAAFLFLIALLLCANGCSSAIAYTRDRCLDLTDVVDVKASVCFGFGAKAEVTDYSGIGFGFAAGPGFESFGRCFVLSDKLNPFVHFAVLGADGEESSELCISMFQYKEKRPPMMSRFRIGGEAYVMPINLGFYLNLGEVVDFLCGLVTYDPSFDDGVAKGKDLFEFVYELELRRLERREKQRIDESSAEVKEGLASLKSDNPRSRSEGARRLGGLEAKCVIPSLMIALDDDDPRVGAAAAEAIGKLADMGDTRALYKLIEHLRFDEDERVRSNVKRALRKITGQDFGESQLDWECWLKKHIDG